MVGTPVASHEGKFNVKSKAHVYPPLLFFSFIPVFIFLVMALNLKNAFSDASGVFLWLWYRIGKDYFCEPVTNLHCRPLAMAQTSVHG